MLPAGEPAPEGERRRDVLLDFGDAVAQLDGRYVTAEDVGTSDADMTVIAERTRHVAGLAVERGGSGDPSPWTALGVEAAIRVTAEAVWGTRRPARPHDRRDRPRATSAARSPARSRPAGAELVVADVGGGEAGARG